MLQLHTICIVICIGTSVFFRIHIFFNISLKFKYLFYFLKITNVTNISNNKPVLLASLTESMNFGF